MNKQGKSNALKAALLTALITSAGLAVHAAVPEGAITTQLKPRVVLAKSERVTFSEEHNTLQRLVVKFAEGSSVRALNGEFVQSVQNTQKSQSGKSAALASTSKRAADLAGINSTLKSLPSLQRTGAVRIERLFARPEATLDNERQAGMARTGEELADLNLYHVLVFDSAVSRDDAMAVANSLIKMGVVETAYFEPKTQLNATDIAPATSAFDSQQNHLDRAYDGVATDPATGLMYNGIDARYAWGFPGGRGASTKFVDIEFGWNTDHEDLNPPTLNRDADTSDRWHGTAVLGLINAQPNGYGMNGIASDAKYGLINVASQTGSAIVDNIALAINRAAAITSAGDVILIEVGIDFDYKAAGCVYPYYSSYTAVPVEHYQAVFDAIKSATANGIIVVETASNGSANLDDPCFGNRYNRAIRDSGAIMVGSSAKGGLSRTLTTSYGARVDVQAQGNQVATTVSAEDFNNLFKITPSDENQQYTSLFDGTSSAGAIVTGAVLSLQGIQKARNGRTFSPSRMLKLLKDHGTNPANFAFYARGGENGIGPMPNLRATIDWMRTDSDGDGVNNGDELSAGMDAQAPGYIVTVQSSGNGTVSPGSMSVPVEGTAWFTASPNPGYTAVFSSGTCPAGTSYGNAFRTGVITGPCTVQLVFAPVPNSPSNVKAKAGNASASFQFTRPSSDTMAPITSYTVSCNGGAVVASGIAPPIRVAGLTNGVNYACSVAALNAAGSSLPSAVVQVMPIASVDFILPINRGK
ncbi:MAG: S8 family serine peptidase [Betaproteobacteria bacterium]